MAKPLILYWLRGHAAIKILQSSRMSNSTFTDDNERCPQGGVRVLCGPGVDHGHHGLPVCLGTRETGLCHCQHTGGESNSSIRDDRPV